MFIERQTFFVTAFTCPRLKVPFTLQRYVPKQSTYTNLYTKKPLSLWLQSQPHLQCPKLGCGKEISLWRVWVGNHCPGFQSPTLGFVDFSLDHMPNPLKIYVSVCVRVPERGAVCCGGSVVWLVLTICLQSFFFYCFPLPVPTLAPPFLT